VGLDDNFFDLGGDSLKASELQTELLRSLGVQLDLQDLVRNATVRDMAGAVRGTGSRAAPVDSVMLPVRTEGSKPKLFLVHGALGQAFMSPVFLDALGPEQPLYAFQARGLDGKQPTNRTVTAMAIDYNRTLQSEQPEGPYILSGLCAGGLVALEMARRLQAAGHPPKTVILIDPPHRLIEGHQLPTKLVRMLSLFRARLSLRRGGGRRTRELDASLRRQEGEGRIAPTRDTQARVDASLRAALDFKMAVLVHRPRPYTGTVHVIHSRKRAGGGDQKAWRRHVHGILSFSEAGAEHKDLLVPGNQAFAQHLRRCIDEALPTRSPTS
jgi:thioesterase domain-containing protein